MDKDLLQKLFNNQQRFMNFLKFPVIEGDYLESPIFKAAVDGIVTESAEVLSEISILTKPWKNKPREKIREDLLKECIDVLFMLIEVLILAGISPEKTLEIYEKKLLFNLYRLNVLSNGKDEKLTEWIKELEDNQKKS